MTSFGVYDSRTKAATQKFETMIVNMIKAKWLYESQSVKMILYQVLIDMGLFVSSFIRFGIWYLYGLENEKDK